MEVIEIISLFINEENNIIKVEFQMIEDEGIRSDVIEYDEFINFGYKTESMNVFDDIDDDNWDDWNEDDSDVTIDDDTMLSFLNEYYTVFPNRIPDEEFI